MSKDLKVARQCQESYSKAISHAGADQQNNEVQESGGFDESVQVDGASTLGILCVARCGVLTM